MKQWTITGTEKDFDGLEFGDVQVPKVGDNDVLVKIGGVSINYRDLIIPKVSFETRVYEQRLRGHLADIHQQGQYPFPTKFPVAACSDGSGEVVEVGPKVTRFQKGDKVRVLAVHRTV